MRNERKKWLFKGLFLLMLALMAMPAGASAKISFSQKKFTLAAGESTRLELMGLTGEESQIEWKVRRENVAYISKAGVVTAKEEGVTYIYAVVDGVKCRCKLYVTDPERVIRLNRSKKSIRKGKTYQLKATIEPESSGNLKVKWKSSNKKVARVNSRGKVTAVGAGTARITAYTKYGNVKKASCKITVKLAPIKLSVKTQYLVVGKRTRLKVVSDTEGSTFKWSSSDKSVVTVTKTGKLKGKKTGTAEVTVKRLEDGKTATCTVTVVTDGQGQTANGPSANAQKLLQLMQKYSDRVKADKKLGIKWVYSNSAKNNWPDAYKTSRKKKVAYMNCALGPRWALREMGLLDSANFWGSAGYVTYRGTAKEQLLKHCVILEVNKTPNELLAEDNLLPGDICTYVTFGHTNVYAGDGLWYECGRSGTGKYVGGEYIFDTFGPLASIGMSSTKIGTIIRLV